MSGGDLIERREFPTRYNALPRIAGPTNPNNQMVTPREVALRASVPLDYPPSIERSEAEDRFRQTEARVALAERTNQGLLEEVARTKNELRAQIRRAEEAVQNEQAARQMLENSLQGSRDVILQLAGRLQRAEEKRQEDRGVIAGLATQLRGVEQQSSLAQKDSFTRRELQAARMEEMLTQLNDAVRSKDQLERRVYEMTSELQQIRAKVDGQSMDLVMTTRELKNKSIKLEEENKFAVENIRKTSETQSYAEQSASHLKSLIEQRLIEARDAILDLRSKQDIQQKEQRSAEQRFASRLSELQLHMGEQNRKRDESMLAMELAQRDREHAMDLEMGRLQSRTTEISEDLNNRLTQKDMKIREETQMRYAQLEMALASEIETRERSTRVLKDEVDSHLELLRKTMSEEIGHMKEVHVNEKKKMNETLHKLNDALTLVEQQLEESKRQQDRLFAAEIQSRKLMESTLMSKIIELEEKLLTTVKILQDNMAGVANQTQTKEDLLEELTRKQESQMRMIAELDKRLSLLLPPEEDPRNQYIEELRTQMAEEARHRDEEVRGLRQQISSTSLAESQKYARKLSELQLEISKLAEAMESIKSEMGDKIEEEEEKLDELKEEVENLRKPSGKKGFVPDIDEEEEEGKDEKNEEEEKEEDEGEERDKEVKDEDEEEENKEDKKPNYKDDDEEEEEEDDKDKKRKQKNEDDEEEEEEDDKDKKRKHKNEDDEEEEEEDDKDKKRKHKDEEEEEEEEEDDKDKKQKHKKQDDEEEEEEEDKKRKRKDEDDEEEEEEEDDKDKKQKHKKQDDEEEEEEEEDKEKKRKHKDEDDEEEEEEDNKDKKQKHKKQDDEEEEEEDKDEKRKHKDEDDEEEEEEDDKDKRRKHKKEDDEEEEEEDERKDRKKKAGTS